MEVLMVAAELGPHARLTPAADSIGALAKAIRQLGHAVTVVLPKASGSQSAGPPLARRLSPLQIEPGLEATVLDGQLASGVSLVVLDMPDLGQVGSEGSAGFRSALFSRAAAALVRERQEQGRKVDVVHSHDWPAAPVAALLSAATAPPTVLTLHSFGEERTFAAESFASFGPAALDPRARIGGRVSPLRIGIIAARAVTTVSPGYAQVLGQSALAGLLGQLAEPLVGVLGGVDYAVYNPATDAAIESRYDAEDLSNKERCRTALSRTTGLALDPPLPLLVALLAGTDVRGRERLLQVLPRLLDLPLRIVVAGAVDAETSQQLTSLVDEYAGDLGLLLKGDDSDLRRCLAAADFALTIRDPAPEGHVELAAQRYGALPIAQATGGVLDVVIDVDAELETGTGFLYEPAQADALVGAVQRAVSAFSDARFRSLRRRIMRRDVGWDRPARRYLQIYSRARGEQAIG